MEGSLIEMNDVVQICNEIIELYKAKTQEDVNMIKECTEEHVDQLQEWERKETLQKREIASKIFIIK